MNVDMLVKLESKGMSVLISGLQLDQLERSFVTEQLVSVGMMAKAMLCGAICGSLLHMSSVRVYAWVHSLQLAKPHKLQRYLKVTL